jgi:hypothetical protein
MAVPFRKLVVRPYAPWRRVTLLGGGVVVFLVLLYGAFELGRYDAGFRVVDSMRGALTASARIRALETENAAQRTQLEAAEVARRVDREGYKQVEQSLGDMQSQIARLNQDLAFYKGLVQPDSNAGVKVQQLQILPDARAGQFRLKFVLMQVGNSKSTVNGTVVLTVEGLQAGKPLNLGLDRIGADSHVTRSFSFRYFEDYDEPVHLPAGFEPTRVDVEIYAGRDTSHGFRQAFVWKAQGMSVETDPEKGTQPKGALDVQAKPQQP